MKPIPFEAPGVPLPEIDPIKQKIVERLEAYIETQFCTDAHRRELVAAYLTGMVSAADLLSPSRKRKFLILPAVLHNKLLNFAKGLGMVFEETKDE